MNDPAALGVAVGKSEAGGQRAALWVWTKALAH